MNILPFRAAKCDCKLCLNRHPAYGKRLESIKPRYQWNGTSWVTRERVKLLKRNHHTGIVELSDGRQVKRHINKHRVLFEI